MPIRNILDATLIEDVNDTMARRIESEIFFNKRIIDFNPDSFNNFMLNKRYNPIKYRLPDDNEANKLLEKRGLSENWELVLVIDSRELSRVDKEELKRNLEKFGVICKTEKLIIGDYQWLLRDKESGIEILTDYIIERKRFGDLVTSFFDSRYDVQKFWLTTSGLHHIIYLIEGNISGVSMCERQTDELMDKSGIEGGFMVKKIYTHERIDFLYKFHKTLKKQLKGNIVNSGLLTTPPIQYKLYQFHSQIRTRINLIEYFGLQLLQIDDYDTIRIKRLLSVYPTPNIFWRNYQNNKLNEYKDGDGTIFSGNFDEYWNTYFGLWNKVY